MWIGGAWALSIAFEVEIRRAFFGSTGALMVIGAGVLLGLGEYRKLDARLKSEEAKLAREPSE